MNGMSYTLPTFTLPVNNRRMTDAEYALRVGNITQAEYDQLMKAAQRPSLGV